MMSSLLLFIHFLRYELSPMNYSEADRNADWWDAELTNLLLPGSCDAPPCSKPISERALDIARDADEILQEMLKQLISPEFSAHLCYVPPKGLFDMVDPEDGVTEYWGYLRQHLNKNRKPSYLAFQIRKDKMVEIGKQLFPLECDDWEKLLQRLKKKKPAYLCFIRPESMPIDEMERAAKKTATALIFDIGKFDFLSEEGKKYLHNRFLGMEDQAAWADASEAELKREAAAKNKATGSEADRIDETEVDLSTLAQL